MAKLLQSAEAQVEGGLILKPIKSTMKIISLIILFSVNIHPLVLYELIL